MQPLQLFFNYRNMREGPIYSLPLNFPMDIFTLHNLSWILTTPPVLGKEVIATIAINPNSKDNNKYETKGVYVSITNEPMEENYYNNYITDEYKVTSLGYDYPENHIEDWNSKVEKEAKKNEAEYVNAARWDAIPEHKDPISLIREFFNSPHMTATPGVDSNGVRTLVYKITTLSDIVMYDTNKELPLKTGFATDETCGGKSYAVVYSILRAWSRVEWLYDLVDKLNEKLRPNGISISATSYGIDSDTLDIKVGLWDNGMYKYGFPFTTYNHLEKIPAMGVKYIAHVADALRDNSDAINAIQSIIVHAARHMLGKPTIEQIIRVEHM